MACIALQNGCFGEDALATSRRQVAIEAGALATVIELVKSHEANAAEASYNFVEVGIATLRLLVHKVEGARQQAVAMGAASEWVKPIKPPKGSGSSRGAVGLLRGFGTSRSRANKNAIKEN